MTEFWHETFQIYGQYIEVYAHQKSCQNTNFKGLKYADYRTNPCIILFCSNLENKFNYPIKRIYFLMKFYHMINNISNYINTKNEVKTTELKVWNGSKTETPLYSKNMILQKFIIFKSIFLCLINTYKLITL